MPKRKRDTVPEVLAILGPTLVLLRRVRRLTQAQIAERTGLNRCNLSEIERGSQIPCVSTLLAYLGATRTDLEQFGRLLEHVRALGKVQDPPTPRQVGAAVRLLRRQARLNYDQLAAGTGVAWSVVWSLEVARDRTSTEQLLRVLTGLDSSLQEVQSVAGLASARVEEQR